jgi:hypothetical protein
MDAVSKESNELSIKRIALQNSFKEYNEKNGFSYEEWVNLMFALLYGTIQLSYLIIRRIYAIKYFWSPS